MRSRQSVSVHVVHSVVPGPRCSRVPRRAAAMLLASAALLPAQPAALARDAFHTYGVHGFRAVPLPPIGPGSFDIRGDYLPDGRIVAVTGLSIFLENAPGSGTFHEAAILDAATVGGATDPSFLRVSPDGSSIAVGAGFARPVAVFSTSSLGPVGSPTPLTPAGGGGGGGGARYFNVPHFEGAWADGSHLAVTAGDFGSPSFVTLLDVTSSTAAPLNPMIVSNIGGASAGIAFDAGGRLYTGNGFDIDPSSGSTTGTIRAFASSEWNGAVPANFETGGALVADVLSAGSLLFDAEGNLIVGGGEFGADSGYLGVINALALADALAGAGPIDSSDLADLRRLDPLGTGAGYFAAAFNPLTGELAVTSGATWHITIPAPATFLSASTFAFIFARRRNRAR